MVVFRQKFLFSGKSGYIRVKVVVFWQSNCNGTKVVVFEKKWLYSGKVFAFGQKRVVFQQKWLYLGKSGCSRAKWLYSGQIGFY